MNSIILVLLLFAPPKESIYTAKKQLCTTINATTITWKLKLRDDSTFQYDISELSTLKIKRGEKNDTLSFNGNWTMVKDTLVLKSNELTGYCNSEVKYLKRKNSLYSLDNCIDFMKGRNIKFEYLQLQKRK